MDGPEVNDGKSSQGSDAGGGEAAPPRKDGAASAIGDDGKHASPSDAHPPDGGRPHKRRKRHGTNDGDGGHCNLGESATVDDLSATDVTTYLAWVHRQAQALPDVFVANGGMKEGKEESEKESAEEAPCASDDKGEEVPFEGSRAALRVLLSQRMDALPPPSARHLPAHAENGGKTNSISNNTVSNWVSSTVSNFSSLRTYLEQERAKLSAPERKVAVPRMKDRAAWHVFCLGKEEAYGNAGGRYEEDSEDEGSEEGEGTTNGANRQRTEARDSKEHSDAAQSSSSDRTVYDPAHVPANGYPPTASLLLQFDQVLTRTLFHHHVHYLCEWNFPLTSARAAWMYALLARMEKPWHREECAAVRRALRECCERRWALKLPGEGETGSDDDDDGEGRKAREQLARLNTLIAITGIYYEQGAFVGGDGMDSLFGVRAKS